jgi:hypothetical protein
MKLKVHENPYMGLDVDLIAFVSLSTWEIHVQIWIHVLKKNDIYFIYKYLQWFL